MTFGKKIILIAPIILATGAFADSTPNYDHDRFRWDFNLHAKSTRDTPNYDICILHDTRVIGLKSSPADTSKNLVPITLDPSGPFLGLGDAQAHLEKDHQRNACPDVQAPKDFWAGNKVWVDLEAIDQASRSGFDYGVLIVPFKAQLSGKQAIMGSATMGGYMGYTFPWLHTSIDVRPIIFAGLSNISTSGIIDGKSENQTVAGLSYGFGLVMDIKKSFQAGIVLGFDHVDSVQPYQYNDRPWLSVEIGYSFTGP